MDWLDFSQELSKQLGQEINILSISSVSGGDISQAYKLHTNIGNLLVKLNRASMYDIFSTELFSLQKINNSQSILAPKGLASGIFNNQAWIAMEFIEMGGRGDDTQRGRDLALMHQQINRSEKPFGWEQNNFIGLTPQSNHWHCDWVEFYGQERLTPQLEIAKRNGMQSGIVAAGRQLIEVLDFWFQDYQPKASLLHGDLWGGNSSFTKEGDPIIYDPASYYGDHETDIALTELFGCYSRDFYQGYNSIFPLDKGYQQRKSLYNLYHIINHFNLFGGSYQQQAGNMIQSLLKQAK